MNTRPVTGPKGAQPVAENDPQRKGSTRRRSARPYDERIAPGWYIMPAPPLVSTLDSLGWASATRCQVTIAGFTLLRRGS